MIIPESLLEETGNIILRQIEGTSSLTQIGYILNKNGNVFSLTSTGSDTVRILYR